MQHGVSLFTVMLTLGLGLNGLAHGQARVDGSATNSTGASADTNGAAAAQSSRGNAAVATDSNELRLAEDTELSAELTRRVDMRRAEPGDEITAELTEAVNANGRVLLPKGTRLVGRITAVEQPGTGGADAEGAARAGLGIAFEKAMIGRGREVPLQATIQALAAAESSLRQRGDRGDSSREPAYRHGSQPAQDIVRTGGGVLGGASSAVAGSAGSVGSVSSVGSTLGAQVSAAARAGGMIHQSVGALGGPDAAGRLMAGSHGVFGLEGIDLVTRGQAAAAGTAAAGTAAGSAGATLITSTSGNFRLDRGTQLLLSTSQTAQASGRVAR